MVKRACVGGLTRGLSLNNGEIRENQGKSGIFYLEYWWQP